jgi:hypothetical protein
MHAPISMVNHMLALYEEQAKTDMQTLLSLIAVGVQQDMGRWACAPDGRSRRSSASPQLVLSSSRNAVKW